MKKFEEEMKEWFGSPTGLNMEFQSGYEAYSALVKHFKDWVSPEDHQAEIKEIKAELNKWKMEANKLDKQQEPLHEKINELKSQLAKQQPEIPEFVAKLIEERGLPEDGVCKNYVIQSNEEVKVQEWINNHQRTWLRALLNGYTVAKEKWFYLKSDKQLYDKGEDRSAYLDLYLDNDGDFVTEKIDARKFTQQEIDSMETGSYEQIEVGE